MLKTFSLYNNLSLKNVFKRQTSTVSLFVNKVPVTVPSDYSVLQACRHAGAIIPTFCYHERLSVAGNCRMCLVEIEGSVKPIIACAFPVQKNMKVNTASPVTRRAQESVLEFILVNHPLDCPICDQGGECDLQDLAMRYGNDKSRFTDVHFSGKRASENCNLGPLIQTEMTRCIHCTRCVRFASQVCGVDVLGSTGRGNDMLIGTYVDKMFLSELSGNVIDLCPVGALTNRNYAFKARPWELKKVESIDVTDATGTNIVLSALNDQVLRVVPRENPEVNQEWVSDKGRWFIDSLQMQRLVTPMTKANDLLFPIDWPCALKCIAEILLNKDPKNVYAIAGPQTNAETLVVVKDLLNHLNIENTYVERDLYYSISDIDLRAGYSLNMNMCDVAKADKILLIGTNPRFEAPILNAWIRYAYINNDCEIYYIGEDTSFNYCVKKIGSDIDCINKLYSDSFVKASHPLIFIGVQQTALHETSLLMDSLEKLMKLLRCERGWSLLHIIPREASWCGALECGWKPGGARFLAQTPPELVFLLGADEILKKWKPPPKCQVVYVGYQGICAVNIADFVLPGVPFTESGGVYLNMECRSQYASPAVTPPGLARSDWMIFRALAEYCNVYLRYHNTQTLSFRMEEISPNLVYWGSYQNKLNSEFVRKLFIEPKGDEDDCMELKVEIKELQDYYCHESFTTHSRTMRSARDAAIRNAASPYSQI